MEKVHAYYQEKLFSLTQPGPLAQSMYRAKCFNVQQAFADWKRSDWQSGRRDAEEALMNAILAIDASFHGDVDTQYRYFLAQHLHLLVTVTMDQSHYLLNDPSIVFAEFLVHDESYRFLIDKNDDFAALAWLCVSAADTFKEEPNGDENAVLDTLVYRMVEHHIEDVQWPTSRALVDILYGPSCWDLYSLDDLNPIDTMPANVIKQAGLRVLVKNSTALEKDNLSLPNDVDVSSSPTLN